MSEELALLARGPFEMTRAAARRIYSSLAGGRALVFQDEIDAQTVAGRFLEACAVGAGVPTEIRWAQHHNDGHTGTLWMGYQLRAITTVVRNDSNFSVLVCTIVRA